MLELMTISNGNGYMSGMTFVYPPLNGWLALERIIFVGGGSSEVKRRSSSLSGAGKSGSSVLSLACRCCSYISDKLGAVVTEADRSRVALRHIVQRRSVFFASNEAKSSLASSEDNPSIFSVHRSQIESTAHVELATGFRFRFFSRVLGGDDGAGGAGGFVR